MKSADEAYIDWLDYESQDQTHSYRETIEKDSLEALFVKERLVHD